MNIEITCPVCNFSKTVPEDRIPKTVRWAVCPGCRHRFEFAQVKTNSVKDTLSPWERRMEVGLWRGIFQTFTAVLFSPGEFFRDIKQGKGIGEPMSFGLLLGSLGDMVGFFWEFILVSMGMLSYGSGPLIQVPVTRLFFIAMIASPFLVILHMFVAGAVIHALMLLFRGGKGGFGGTFKVVAFGQAAKILAIIPFAGGIAGWFWSIVIAVTGLKEVHETSYLKTIAAVIIPIVVKAGLLGAVLLLVSFFESASLLQ